MLFKGESCFSVRPKKNRLHVRRHRGKRYLTKLTIPPFKSGYLSVSVRGGFFALGRTSLVGTVGSFDQRTYRVIVDNQILPFMYNVHNGPACSVF